MNKRRVALACIMLFFAGIPACIFMQEDSRLVNQGYNNLVNGNVGKAEKQFKAALDANPDNPYAMLNLGVIYARTGRIEEARVLYRKVIDFATANPTYPARVGDVEVRGESLKEIAETNLERLN